MTGVNTLYVCWDHDYYWCHNFTVYLNDNAVSECTNITALNCTIRGLDAGTKYNVSIVAIESDTEPIEATRIATTRQGMCYS